MWPGGWIPYSGDFATIPIEPGPETQPMIPAADPVPVGATCVRCNEYNEYAEPSETHICYSCRQDGWPW